ncbi:FAD-binding oxidoreductase [Rhodobacteraceae bacterium RKSG542]|uniref:NAD(P)/FAD-dependent oxidoreductase n=1 Tax=Pseudovibrio flavus TaxID=2529854 RepID=UPI0012BBB12D|nr:FAD-dependent oxidoreductase [Pseudovibrio flavus]MTI18318.1 FAD-binding oxidoreductase [Pseudovibrio flavus]
MTAYDLAIVGGGIFGLSLANAAMRYGLKVALIEKNTIASGASNGLVGALMPHIPARWNEKKQFQFDALLELPEIVKNLEQATGISTGYSRSGRLVPIYTQAKLDHALAREEESRQHWKTEKTGFECKVIERSPVENWPAPETAPLGYTWDNLAARANPRMVSAAIRQLITPRVHIMEHTCVTTIDDKAGKVETADGRTITADRIILTAGYEGFDLIKDLTGKQLGKGVKGQSLLLEKAFDQEMPVVYDSGIYVVAHQNGTVAIGSTSEEEWDTTEPQPADIKEMHQKAVRLCPALKDAPVIHTWAGIRPKCLKRDPLLGPLPDFDRTWVVTGGFKISYAIAHRIAKAALERIFPHEAPAIALPDSFLISHHWK